ncbi:long-chain fatty acid--CoA ligase [Gordonia desulfuricans]|uniref:Long-chain fatty acid--CoA ligase n=1 Tax=Gordonia desulfuricans TaxID=89051 RepID=A0A7K3LT62_9ACTN|nr:long-chain fatty acid--CoA ligase [Gordonia desulfuricans]NDK91474.1 long-chain fatty acid--CoA ligase [Gordonia desulfuricans]
MNPLGLATWLSARAQRDPHKPALTFENETWKYAELQRRVEEQAAFLASTGVSVGDRVAYLGMNHSNFLVALFAVNRLGATFVPLNYRLADDELTYILDDAGATALIADGQHVPIIDRIRGSLAVQSYLTFDGEFDGWLQHGPAEGGSVPEVEVSPDDVAAILYTSGTTGRPKGSILTHRNIWTGNVNWMLAVNYHGEHIALTSAPLFHSGGLCVMTLPVLMAGGHVIIHERFDADRVLADVETYRVTSLFLVPTMMLYLTQEATFDSADLSSLQIIVAGAAPVPKHLLELFGSRGIPVSQCWGMTETSTGATFLGTERALDKLGSCGTPGMLNEVKLIDFDGNDLNTPGVPGELCVRGDTVTPGYWNLPDATAAAQLDGGWFKTGDVAYQDSDGFYFICDRLKDLIISGGENVYPAEVESAIYTHSAVAEVAVIGMPDPEWGERVAAVVVPKQGATIELDELREFLGGALARYKLPRELVVVDELPRNTTGKIMKHVLRKDVGAIRS